MRLLPTILAALLVAGCQTTPRDYQALSQAYAAGNDVSPKELRQAFMSAPDLPQRLERLNGLEAQALAVVEDEPLKLGSIGSAILDTYVGSLTGHYVLERFYERVSNAKAEFHRQWVERIQKSMEAAGDGTLEHPYPAVTPVEARMYALSKGWSPVGSIYQTDEDHGVPFALLLRVRPEKGPLKSLTFDLSGLYHTMSQQFTSAVAKMSDKSAKDSAAAGGKPPVEADFTPFTLIGYLARQGDTAAQTSVGGFLASKRRFDDAVEWLRAASRSGNLLANEYLGGIFLEKARLADSDEARKQALDQVMENYLHAIALGSANAMYALGVLYLNGHYGKDNRASGVPLLKQASALGESDATMFLAHLHYAGEVVDKDFDAARKLYAESAAEGNVDARKSYARFLLDRDTHQAGDPRAVHWLEETAKDGEPESLLLLGNLHARGIGTHQSARRALSYFKQAVKRAPEDPTIVNEVAWTLAVTDQNALRHADYARQIMDHLMEADDQARKRPEYLDTWAATYAATGQFERAVTLQQQAVDAARKSDDDAVLDILKEHLQTFSSGKTLSEAVP